MPTPSPSKPFLTDLPPSSPLSSLSSSPTRRVEPQTPFTIGDVSPEPPSSPTDRLLPLPSRHPGGKGYSVTTPTATAQARSSVADVDPIRRNLWGQAHPSMSSEPDSIIMSSPALTKSAKKRKGHKRRVKTLQVNKAREREQAAIAEATLAEEHEALKRTTFSEIIDLLEHNELTLGEFLLHVFNPANQSRGWRWTHFFVRPNDVHQVLDYWVSKDNSKTAHRTIKGWMTGYMVKTVSHEADNITARGVLRVPGDVDADFALGMDYANLAPLIQSHCPTTMKLLTSVAKTERQVRECSDVKLKQKDFLAATSAVSLLGERSQKNRYARHVMGLYLYSTGATRQQISVFNHLGQTVSYVTLAGRGGKGEDAVSPPQEVDSEPLSVTKDGGGRSDETREAPGLAGGTATGEQLSPATAQQDYPTTPKIPSKSSTASSESKEKSEKNRQLGTLERLSLSMRKVTQEIAADDEVMVVYDNINMQWKSPEQVIGRTGPPDTQENGTCATCIPLFKANKEALKTSHLDVSFDNAAPLSIEDIKLSKSEGDTLRQSLIHTVLRVIVRYGGPKFQSFRKELQECAPSTSKKIELHKTAVYPLPAMNINEASTRGNAEVVEAIFKELKKDMSDPLFGETIKLLAGDQLSIARLRAIAANRAGNEGGASALRWALFIPGLFHYKLAATHGIMQTHLGLVNHDLSNPASLAAHNTLLKRKPILITSLPPFRTCRDLIFVSLYARVLHCLLLVSETASLHDYTEDMTWDQLQSHAATIVDQFTDNKRVSRLRRARTRQGDKHGDMVFENAVLFLRDALILREFTDAIKSGDSGRILTVLKVWAFSYRGQGRAKNAQEVLYLIHNVTHVWPESLVEVVFNNWLVNPSGKVNAWHEVDLLQEHLNFWIKDYYQAHGSAASWEWLATISPCVEILRRLATEINASLGAKQGNRHAEADLTDDIDELMGSLAHHGVYREQLGRTFDSDDTPARDVIASGLTALTWGNVNPLTEFNNTFATLQRRRRIPPLVNGSLPMATTSATVTPVSSAKDASAAAITPSDPRGQSPSVPRNESDADGEGDEEANTSEEESDMDDDDGRRTELDLAGPEDVALDMDDDEVPWEDRDVDEERNYDSDVGLNVGAGSDGEDDP
ncbi:hypothetical protein BV25DRAFT_1903821 [Artomyces pyxidatus]|uniref:Uncharacterized protein n=1 Tax=Artomyces pyxidatus TaxID=48021 RepID=A0ACB8SER1_9AGAM|nr:hypothetical protein BV25DRAFT_1903821 [Artomyces pyxidatus]